MCSQASSYLYNHLMYNDTALEVYLTRIIGKLVSTFVDYLFVGSGTPMEHYKIGLWNLSIIALFLTPLYIFRG